MTASWSCDRRVSGRSDWWPGGAHERDRVGLCGSLRVAGSLVRAWHSTAGGLRSRVVSLRSRTASSHVTGKQTAPPAWKRRRGGSDGMPRWLPVGSRPSLGLFADHPRTAEAPVLLMGITGRVRARTARPDRVRDPESRATETRVRPVPAVAMRGRSVSVADDTAERPVQACTLSGAARRMRGRRSPRGARGRMIDSTMVSHRRCESGKQKSRRRRSRRIDEIRRRPNAM
jgi:hypothetical protein